MEILGKTKECLILCMLNDNEVAFLELALSLNKPNTAVKRKKSSIKKRRLSFTPLPKQRRLRKHITIDGQAYTRTEAAEVLGIAYSTLCRYAHKGMSDEAIVKRVRS